MTANRTTSADDTDAAGGHKTATRLRNPNAGDETGKRILGAGLALLEQGRAIFEVRLADACVAATAEKPSLPITSGAAYPRFRKGQNEFRLRVLAHLLRRDHGLHRRTGSERADDALNELATDSPVSPTSVRAYIEHLALGQVASIGDDSMFALRIYAMRLVADREDFPDRELLLPELRAADADSDRRWTNNFQVLMSDYGLCPRQEFEETDFELLLGALASGLAVKRLIASPDESERIDRLFAPLIAAAAIGFFSTAEDADEESAWAALTARLESSRSAMQRDDEHAETYTPDDQVAPSSNRPY